MVSRENMPALRDRAAPDSRIPMRDRGLSGQNGENHERLPRMVRAEKGNNKWLNFLSETSGTK